MIIQKTLALSIFLFFASQDALAIPLAEQFKRTGYLEISDTAHGTQTFDALYAHIEDQKN